MAIDQDKAQKQLGAIIRDNRKASGYSQEEFASYCGVHRTYMGAIERGERNISLMNIIRIANALKMKPSELFTLAKL
ncbi:MAG: helix-turn-helix transcriptional regulator [Gammaproteobacteria bacterium]|nr:helix-turn-helix transcriptional regulator [Gammaproteobacteria bacterium]